MILELLVLSHIANPKQTPQPPELVSIVETITKKKEPVKHKVKRGDTLVKIAKKYDTNWQRIYYKNKKLDNPDSLNVGQSLTIPSKHEKLKKRKLYQSVSKSTSDSPKIAHTGNKSPRSGTAPAGWYSPGQCTHHVWTKRPVGKWGNASDWLWQAKRDGFAVSSTPRAGSIAWKPGHVAFVISVSGNKMTISEANYDWRGSVRTITIPISNYKMFIY